MRKVLVVLCLAVILAMLFTSFLPMPAGSVSLLDRILWVAERANLVSLTMKNVPGEEGKCEIRAGIHYRDLLGRFFLEALGFKEYNVGGDLTHLLKLTADFPCPTSSPAGWAITVMPDGESVWIKNSSQLPLRVTLPAGVLVSILLLIAVLWRGSDPKSRNFILAPSGAS